MQVPTVSPFRAAMTGPVRAGKTARWRSSVGSIAPSSTEPVNKRCRSREGLVSTANAPRVPAAPNESAWRRSLVPVARAQPSARVASVIGRRREAAGLPPRARRPVPSGRPSTAPANRRLAAVALRWWVSWWEAPWSRCSGRSLSCFAGDLPGPARRPSEPPDGLEIGSTASGQGSTQGAWPKGVRGPLRPARRRCRSHEHWLFCA
jgi:hypothetical protein